LCRRVFRIDLDRFLEKIDSWLAFAACSLRRGVDLSLLGREGQDNKKGFASSSEVSDQNNVVGLRTMSKHKIGSICGKSKSKDEIRFEVG